MSLASLVILSLMLVVEVAALVLLGWYIWRTPAWTSTLKSLTVAQLANAMDKDTLPPARTMDDKALKVLHKVDGRVGVAFSGDEDGKPLMQQLMHGGPEGLPPPAVRKRGKSSWTLY